MVGRELTDYYHKHQIDPGEPVLAGRGRSSHPVRSSPSRSRCTPARWSGSPASSAPGRTELLETIFGVRRAHGGRVLVGGREVRAGSPRAALESGIALVPEERHRRG